MADKKNLTQNGQQAGRNEQQNKQGQAFGQQRQAGQAHVGGKQLSQQKQGERTEQRGEESRTRNNQFNKEDNNY